jgi:hypothetical protein
VNHVAVEQLQERSSATPPDLDQTALIGTWINTNSAPTLIRRLEIATGQKQLTVHISGAEPGLPEDWGVAEAHPFAENTASGLAMAFSVLFDLNGVESLLQGYVVKGVLVIISFIRVKDGRVRSSSFGKEFFYRLP